MATTFLASRKSTGWRIATVCVAVIAVAVGLWGYQQMERVNQLTADLQNSQAFLQAVKSDLQHSNTKLQAAEKPDLPVLVGFRKAFLHPGLVAVFRNISPKTLEVVVNIEDPTTHQTKSGSLVIDAFHIREIGYHQGWEFVPGQHIKLSNPKYRPIDAIVTGS